MENIDFDVREFIKKLEETHPEEYSNPKVKQMLEVSIENFYRNKNEDEEYDDSLFSLLEYLCPEIEPQIIVAYGHHFSNEAHLYAEGDYRSEYMLLSRLKEDCDYYLGNGNRHEKHLWSENVMTHIAKMNDIYSIIPFKPEWLSKQDIQRYEREMTTLKSLDNLWDFLEYHGWTVRAYGNDWDIEQYSPAGESFSFYITHDGSLTKAIDEICNYARDFDAMDHAEIWTPGENNVPDRETLIEDAKTIQRMLNEIEYVLNGCEIIDKDLEIDR